MIISMLALLAIATTAEAQVQINETNFPDEQFRNYVKSKLDIDQDGVLSTIEISAAQNLVLPTTIANHKGIEYFTEMTNLNCSNSYLTKLDLSKNTKLSFLQCENNLSLSSLVFPKTNLGGLICKKNALTSLDVSGAAKLWTFTIEESQLTSLNVSGCTELKKLDCQNGKLASLNASGCTALKTLNCSNNKLTSLNVSGCTALTELDCRNNSLTSLNVSANTKLITLNCGSNSLTSLNVSGCTKLEDLSCRNNKLTSLNVSGFTELANLDCAKNQLASLNVSANTKLYFLFCYSNKIKGTAMQTLVESLGSNGSMFYAIDKKDANEQNTITEEQAGIAMAKGWHTYDWYGGNPKEIDAYIAINATNFPDPNFRNWLLAQSYGKDSKLYKTELDGVTTMDVSGKSIANLKGIEFFEKLTHLNCSNNQLTALDVSSFPQLRELKCYGNQIKIAANMDALIESRRQGSSLPSSAYLYAIDTKNSNEQNVLTTFQVSRAKNKGWIVMDNNGGDPVQYAGTDSGFSIDEKTFPDANFRNYVNSNIDTNKDGYLSDAEIAAVTSMNVSGKSIENLKGIGFFTALTDLHCHKNKLTSLDLSANTKLSYLECGTNQLTELNVSKNTNLQTIWCNNNKLTALDLSKNTKLTSLYCYGNQIKGDKMQVLVNNLPKVTSGKGKLHVIDTKNSDEQNDITKAQVAIAKGKNWKVYDWNGTSPVEYAGSDDPTPAGIAINETNFPDEKFRNWVLAQSYGKDGILTDAEIAAVTSISVVERSIKNLKGIGFFTALTDLHCHKNKLTSLDLSANTKLSYLDCGTNQLTELNVSKNTNLQTIWC
ncbi:MAG: leucine-rich repeat domain-containing protein, partial [Prevotella sp.]|nr:leucine-rich repeat domain-containing protein [Prevotella sp.]